MIVGFSKAFAKISPPFTKGELYTWIDLINPANSEDKLIEAHCGIEIPTREEMREIEPSSRLYFEKNAAYMTASVICNVDKGTPKLADISFILTGETLVTVRYDEPKSFETFMTRLPKLSQEELNADLLFANLMDTIIDRTADIAEKVHSRIEETSSIIFADEKSHSEIYRNVIKSLGKEGTLISKLSECLVSMSRMLLFISSAQDENELSKDARSIIKTQIRDCEYLSKHCDSLANKITFLLDATLGLVSLEQNSIIKIFSVASVALMPPTLIASIYGMNFKDTPAFEWIGGFYISLGMMVISAIVPYVFFKWKRWL